MYNFAGLIPTPIGELSIAIVLGVSHITDLGNLKLLEGKLICYRVQFNSSNPTMDITTSPPMHLSD